MTTFTSAAFATTVRVINRVHGHATNGRADTLPARCTGLAQLAQAVLFVGHFADGRAAFDVNATDFTGAQANLSVDTFASQQRCGCASRAGDLRALAGLQFDRVDGGTHGDVADRQGVASADRRFGTGQQGCACLLYTSPSPRD